MYRRVQAVLALAQGLTARQAAGLVAASSQAVRQWAHRYLRHHRVQDLQDAPRSGRPGTCRQISDRRIVREFERDPLKLGYASTVWTVPLLAGHLRRTFGCALSARTLRRRMKAMGLVWKRPRYVYSQKDPHRAAKKGALSAA
jgi:transposase